MPRQKTNKSRKAESRPARAAETTRMEAAASAQFEEPAEGSATQASTEAQRPPAPASWSPAPAGGASAGGVNTSSDGFLSGRARILVTAIVLVAVLAVVLWQAGMGGGSGPGTPNAAANNTSAASALDTPQARQLLQLVSLTSGLPGAYSAQIEQQNGADARQISIMSNGSARSISVLTPLYNRTYLFLEGNRTILCEQPVGEGARCALMNASLNRQEAQDLQQFFLPEPGAAAQIADGYRSMMGKSNFNFSGPAGIAQAAGRRCSAFPYQFGTAQIEVCLDGQYGVALRQNMSYDQPRQNASGGIIYVRTNYSLVFASLEFGMPALPAAPELGNEEVVSAMAKNDDAALEALASCRQGATQADANRCLKESAISYNQVHFCELAGNESARGDCIIKMATQTGNLRPELCVKAGAMKSECYANIAYIKNDISYCQMVEDAELKALCLKEVGGIAINTTINNQSVVVRGASQK
ncbi:MAG: hypothetical protein M1530_03435 [Candidatus Marsarchaeota archaeon]|nr:hypothetical protein [Candidatus Marsarchaeota archaeon]